jgi:hypothetical protein
MDPNLPPERRAADLVSTMTLEEKVLKMQSTSPAIPQNGLVVLQDPKHNFLPGNVVPLVSSQKMSDELKKVLDKVSAKLTTEDLTELNASVSGNSGAGVALFDADDGCIDENAISLNGDCLTDEIFCGGISENNTGSNMPVVSQCCAPTMMCQQSCSVPAQCVSNPVEVDTDSIKSARGESAADTLTISGVTVGSQANRILIVTVGAEEDNADCDLSHAAATVTYGGQPLQKAVSAVSDVVAYRTCNGIFYLLNPPTGTADVAITFPSTVGSAIDQRQAGAFVIYNAEQQPPEAIKADGAEGVGIPNPSSTAINVLTENALVVDIMTWGNPGTFTPTEADQMGRWQESCSSSSSAMSTREAMSAGPLPLGFQHSSAPSAGTRQAHSLAAFAPAL